MRRFRAINLIAFCTLVLLVDNNSASISYLLRKYVPALLDNVKGFQTLRRGIVPGTLWCGPGNIARNSSDLGANWMLDTCCRAHDFCRDFIGPQETKYGVYNRAILCRRMLCECDLQFYNCVKKTPGVIAYYVGRIYFRKCSWCLNAYYERETCLERGLDIVEGEDRNGSRVFCARLDRNPRWGPPTSIAVSGLIPEAGPSTGINGQPEEFIPRFYPEDDDEDYEDDEYNDDITDFEMKMLNVF